MKKISSKIIISLLLALTIWSGVSFVFGVEKISAATDCTALDNAAQSTPLGSPERDAARNCLLQQQREAASASTPREGWSFRSIGIKIADVIAGVIDDLTWFPITTLILLIIGTVLNILAAIIAGLFNAVFYLSMSSFGDIVTSAGVTTMWILIRDIINISFIFILLYTAISIILGSFGPQKKSTVAGVVISAVLINFSLFITRIIIDFGNMLAVAIYNKPYSGPGFATLLMEGLQIQTLFSTDLLSATGHVNIIFLQLIQIALVGVFIATLWKGMVLMLGRIIMLIALLATSPIGFIGFSMPWLKDKADDWWSALINQVFLLPIFFFFLMITNLMLQNGARMLFTFNSAFAILDPQQYTQLKPGQWIYFCLIIGMLHLGINMTKKMSGKIGEVMDKVAKGAKIMAAAGIAIGASIVTGGAALAPARAFVGRIAGGSGPLGAAGRGIQNFAGSRLGQTIQRRGVLAGNIYADPGAGGMITRSMTKNALDLIKEHTGLDIAAANKDVKDAQKEYTKYAGEQANKIGPGEVLAEMKLRNDTMENIVARAQNRISKEDEGGFGAALEQNVKNTKNLNDTIADLNEKISKEKDPWEKQTLEGEKQRKTKELGEFEQTAKTLKKQMEVRENALIGNVKKKIADEQGYNLEEHEEKMKKGGTLEKERDRREKARDEYLRTLSERGYRGKKAADILRAVKGGKFEEKSTLEKIVDEIEKQNKKAAKEKEAPAEKK